MIMFLRTVSAVLNDLGSYFWPLNRRNNILRLLLLIAAIIAAWYFLRTEAVPEVSTESQVPVVVVSSAQSLSLNTGTTFIGTVRAVSEAEIQSEVGGRVTGVNVTAGQTVGAGAIIATLENASQRASVLSAEGAYEATLAAAAVGEVGTVEAAQNLQNAVATIKNTISTLTNTVISLYGADLDVLVADTNNVYRTGSVLLRADAALIYPMETAYQSIPASVATLTQQSQRATEVADVLALEKLAETLLITVAVIPDNVTALIQDSDMGSEFNPKEAAFLSRVTNVNAQIASLESQLQSTFVNYRSAQDALRKAELNAGSGAVSATDAQIKSALGNLRSAQASLAKTILRSPIAGTVNTVNVNQGDFIGAFTPVAEIANNNALEISIFVGENDLGTLAVGDTVTIENNLSGTVTNVAPAIDSATLKTEIRIAAESTDLINGSTVTVSTIAAALDAPAVGPILVPLTAVKFTASDGSMFFVTDGVLTTKTVSIGSVQGGNIEIRDGLGRSDMFVVDARGLSAGTQVEIAGNQN